MLLTDSDRILTVLHFLQRGRSTAASHRKINLKAASLLEDKEIQKVRSLGEEEYKLRLTPILAYFITQLVNRNDKIPAPHRGSNVCPSFNAQSAPEISIAYYVQRISKYTPCSPECYLAAIIYIDQIIQTHKMLLNSLNIHRLIITSILIAAKLYDETTYNNKYYSVVGGVALHELNALELQFIALLNFDLNIPWNVYEQYRYQVEMHMIRYLSVPKENTWSSGSGSILVNGGNNNSADGDDDEDADGMDDTYSYSYSKEPIRAPMTAIEAIEAREKSRLIQKDLRRSRSFNTQVLKQENGGLFKWNKRRSSSFNVLAVS